MLKNPQQTWNLQNTYSELPKKFHVKQVPAITKNPKLFYFNKKLAKQLSLDFLNDDILSIEKYLSGNIIPNGSVPIA